MEEKFEDLKIRTRKFALRVIKMYSVLPKSTVAQVLGKQVLRSATSVGAHYREGVRARSTAEYISKLEGGMQELEESLYWFELIVDAKLFDAAKMHDLINEADELMAILTSIVIKEKKKR
jgi:four helix bundle protein